MTAANICCSIYSLSSSGCIRMSGVGLCECVCVCVCVLVSVCVCVCVCVISAIISLECGLYLTRARHAVLGEYRKPDTSCTRNLSTHTQLYITNSPSCTQEVCVRVCVRACVRVQEYSLNNQVTLFKDNS